MTVSTRGRFRRRLTRGLVAAAVMALAAGTATAFGEDEGEQPQPVDFVHNVVDSPAPVTGAVFGSAPAAKPGHTICTTPTQNTANVNTDCEGTNPHNETSIA